MRPKPNDSAHAKIFKSPAAAAAAASVTAAYALTTSEVAITDTRGPNIEVDLSVEISTVKENKKLLESSLSDIQAENSALQAKLDDTNSTHVELSKVLYYIFNKKLISVSCCQRNCLKS